MFYREFNKAFHKPKKSLCDERQAFEKMPNPTDEQNEKQTAHLRRKDRVRNYKDELKSKATGAPHVSSACFNIQQAYLARMDKFSDQFMSYPLVTLSATSGQGQFLQEVKSR